MTRAEELAEDGLRWYAHRGDILPDDTVCACLNDTGERKTRLYERCLRCGAFTEADYLIADAEALAEALEQIEQARPTKGVPLKDTIEGCNHIARAALALYRGEK